MVSVVFIIVLVSCYYQSTVVFVLCPQGCLLYRDTSNHSMSAIKINPETLEHEGGVTMPGTQKAPKRPDVG